MAYSYRDDPTVPRFDDSGPVAFMDGQCALCSFGAQMIARFDRAGDFRICPVETELGAAMLRHYDLEPGDPATWLLLINGKAYSSLDAIIRVGAHVGGIGHVLQVFRLLPLPAQDWLYRRIALNRYRLFGRADICALPDPRLKARLIGVSGP